MDIYREVAHKLVSWPTGRFSMEILSHSSQCLFMLGIAAERYVLISHATRAKEILSPRRRVAFSALITILFLLVLAIPYYAFYVLRTRVLYVCRLRDHSFTNTHFLPFSKQDFGKTKIYLELPEEAPLFTGGSQTSLNLFITLVCSFVASRTHQGLQKWLWFCKSSHS